MKRLQGMLHSPYLWHSPGGTANVLATRSDSEPGLSRAARLAECAAAHFRRPSERSDGAAQFRGHFPAHGPGVGFGRPYGGRITSGELNRGPGKYRRTGLARHEAARPPPGRVSVVSVAKSASPLRRLVTNAQLRRRFRDRPQCALSDDQFEVCSSKAAHGRYLKHFAGMMLNRLAR